MWAMARRRLHPRVRVAFFVCGGALVVLAVVLAFLHIPALAAIVALLTGILLIVFAAIRELPEEIGVRVKSRTAQPEQPDDPERDYRKSVYDAVRRALPDLEPPRRAPDWQPGRPAYWVQELGLRVVVAWSPDPSYQLDSAVLARPDGVAAVLVVTNVDDVSELRAAMRSSPGAVVRWRSSHDTDALRRATRDLRLPS